MKQIPEYEFCMKQFKVAIIGLAVLVVAVLFWTTIHCVNHPETMNFQLVAANTPTPTAPPIKVNDKMLHGYWGNCSKCHLVTDVGKPISKVMTGPKISVNDKMLHKYWGNCLLCHVNTDGIPPKMKANPGNNAKLAAATQLNNRSLGMSLHAVDRTLRDQFGLAIAEGLLVLDVTPNSSAQKANIKKGDVITRIQKTPVKTIQAFQVTLSKIPPGSHAKIRIHRGKRTRNVFVKIPRINGNMTQNQVETLAEQLGVPKTQQAVTRALQQQGNMQRVAQTKPGTVMTQNQVETLAEQLGVPKTQQAVTRALQKQGNAQRVAQITPSTVMTQNQVETLAEQLGVPKTQQAVTRALQKQGNAQRVAQITPSTVMTQNQVETLAEQLGVPKTQQAVSRALQQQGKNQRVAQANLGTVAFGSMGAGLGSNISYQFATSPYFILYDPIRNAYRTIPNPNANDLTGQGVQTAQYLVDMQASNVVAGNFSPAALNALHTLRINVYPGVSGSVKNLLDAYTAGQLRPVQ